MCFKPKNNNLVLKKAILITLAYKCNPYDFEMSITRFKMAAKNHDFRERSCHSKNNNFLIIVFINLKFAYNSNEEINTLFNKIGLQTAEIAMLKEVNT